MERKLEEANIETCHRERKRVIVRDGGAGISAAKKKKNA